MGLRAFARRIPYALATKRRVIKSATAFQRGLTRYTNRSAVDLLAAFPLFAPNSAGHYAGRASMTMQTIQRVFPVLAEFAQWSAGCGVCALDIQTASPNREGIEAAASLKRLLISTEATRQRTTTITTSMAQSCGSRTASSESSRSAWGQTTWTCSQIWGERRSRRSLRAFRDYCVNAEVFGADIDRRILFTEDRITTHYVDQTSPVAFAELRARLPEEFDLVIDDGLHSPHANIASLRFGMGLVKKGGWVVVEDIHQTALPVWQVVSTLIPAGFSSHLVRST